MTELTLYVPKVLLVELRHSLLLKSSTTNIRKTTKGTLTFISSFYPMGRAPFSPCCMPLEIEIMYGVEKC